MPAFLFAFLLSSPARLASPLTLDHPVQDKNFYLLSLLHRSSKVERMLYEDTALASVEKSKEEAYETALRESSLGRVAGLSGLLWSPSEIESVAADLAALCGSKPEVRDFVNRELRPSHAYFRDERLGDAEFLASAWRACAAGMNQIVNIYGLQTEGGPSQEINGPIYRSTNPLFGGLVKTMLMVRKEEWPTQRSFFLPSLTVADGLLACQARDEAGRLEPMERGVNAPAYRAATATRWQDYPYSVLLLPGYGPDEPEIEFSPVGRLACEAAARRYRAKLAPFILTSGGYVHPNRTRFCEALQMKAFLMRECGVPEEAIIVDPHARHTTTNLRNASRLMLRYGFPADRPGLVVTNPFQAADIASVGFANRCQAVFGFQPASHYKLVSPMEVSFLPEPISLTIDPKDPLDP